MVGGNPPGNPYGFRHWNNPGALAEYLHTGKLGQFEGFLAALWYAAFICVGPASSLYIIAMNNLGVDVLPHIVNVLLVITVLSVGNTYVYAASRSLYGLALEGKAPRILRKCTKQVSQSTALRW